MRSKGLVVLKFSPCRWVSKPGQGSADACFQGHFDCVTAEVDGAIVPPSL